MKKPELGWPQRIITIIACIWVVVALGIAARHTQIKNNNAKQYPLIVKGYTPEDNQGAERERAWRTGDTLILGPNGSLIIKPEGMETPDFFATVLQNQDSGLITMPGIVRDIDTSGYD